MSSSRRNKFNAKRTEVDEFSFASKREAAVYQELKADNDVCNIELQPEFPLIINGIKLTQRPYRADFRFFKKSAGQYRIIDVKGVDTREGRLRRRLAEVLHGVTIEVVK